MDGALLWLIAFGILVALSACIVRDTRKNNRVANRPLQGHIRVGVAMVPREEEKP